MGKLISISLFIISLNIFASDVIVISDLDDTIKRTNVSAPAQALYNALFTRKVFPGMPELFDVFNSETKGIYVLSNSPVLFNSNIKKLIEKFNLDIVELSTREIDGSDADKFAYKYDFIIAKMNETGANLILLGDDVGEDPEVYAKVIKNYPDRVLQSYIHIIKNREIPKVVYKYHSFLDIALNEYENKRLNLSQLESLNSSFRDIEKMQSLFPKFKHCPVNYWRTLGSSEIKSIVEKMTIKVIKFCKNR